MRERALWECVRENEIQNDNELLANCDVMRANTGYDDDDRQQVPVPMDMCRAKEGILCRQAYLSDSESQ
jgi:hypothetical protein